MARRVESTSSRLASRIPSQRQTAAFWRWLLLGAAQQVRAAAGFAIAVGALVLVATGVFRQPSYSAAPELLALAGLTLFLLARLFERFHATHPPSNAAHLELGSLFIAAAFVLIELTGGPSGYLYPLIFALVAFLVAFHGKWSSLYFLALILITEAGVFTLQPEPEGWRLFASHASFNLLFGLLYALFLRTEVAERRRSMRREVDAHFRKMADEARDFRLTSGLSLESRELSAEELNKRRRIGSLQAIRESLYYVLAVAERALEPHTVALLWMDSADKHLQVKELRSQSDWVREAPLSAAEGFFGAITKRREPLVLTQLKPGHSGLVYYSRPECVTDFAGVPVLEGSHLRGVLVADRKDGRPFGAADVELMETIASEVVRAVQVERIFTEMDTEKYQKERFYQASREFNDALTLEQVAEVTIRAAQRVTGAELAALATCQHGALEISAVEWVEHPEARHWVGKSFATEEGLVGAAIKARHPLPHGTVRAPSQHVFSPQFAVDLPQVKVVPLLWKEQAVGALVLGSEHADFLPLDLLDMVRVVADHAAIAIANAQMYARMEKMASTDGLTSLVNHRRLQELFDDSLARAVRYQKNLSLILVDIDHFKTVNDTYGHPIGDRVLQRIAGILAANARRTDVVARYGGEEFAVLMEETGKAGAMHIAERIRQAVEQEVFHSDNGTFRCTLSLGLATFPEDRSGKADLIEAADQALYQAKRAGRNRVVDSGSLRAFREVS